MSSKMKWFIAIGILINVLLAGGIYVNYQLDKVVLSLSRPGVLFSDPQPQGPGKDGPGEAAQRIDGDGYWNGSWNDGVGAGPGDGSDKPGSDGTGTGKGVVPNTGNHLERPSNVQIADDVMTKVGRPIDKSDMLRAGVIILKRFNGEEISYLYNVGRKGSMTLDERVKVKKILSAKLSDDDVATLKALGKKYGRSLTVLD